MKKSLLLAPLIIFLSMFAAAEISISQPDSSYNMGDTIMMNVSLVKQSATSDFLVVRLFCENQSLEVHRTPVSVAANEAQNRNMELFLTRSILGDVQGTCVLQASYGGENAQTPTFRLSRKVDVSLIADKASYKPDQVVSLSGTAHKLDGRAVDGFLEIRLDNATFSKTIENGEFSFDITLPDTTGAGSHVVSARVYDKDSNGEIANEGNAEQNINVVQVLRRMTLGTNLLEFSPPAEINYTVHAYDQTDMPYNGEIELNIYNSDKEAALSKMVNSNTDYSFPLISTSVPGTWRFEVKSNDISAEQNFIVQEVMKANFLFENNTLVVSNIGNVVYDKTIEVLIANQTVLRKITLGVGESKQFKLYAPDSTYDVTVSDGDRESTGLALPLTGRAVDLGEIGGYSLTRVLPAFLIVAGLVFFWIAWRIYRIRRRTSFGGATSRSMSMPAPPMSPIVQPKVIKATVSAEAPVSDSGRDKASLIAVKLSNAPQDLLGQLTSKVRSERAQAQLRGDYLICIVSPRLTAVQDHEMHAIRLSQSIQEIIRAYNSQKQTKVYFGIGISSGDIIMNNTGGTFTFTALGNIVSRAQRLAVDSQEEIIVSDSVYKRASPQIKADPTPLGDAWKVKSMVQREQYSGFINSFMKRQGKK